MSFGETITLPSPQSSRQRFRLSWNIWTWSRSFREKVDFNFHFRFGITRGISWPWSRLGEEFKSTDAPNPLLDGDGLFPPKLQRHTTWVYDTGRIATPGASNLEPEGLRPPNQGMAPEQERTSTSMPKTTPSHRPKRATSSRLRALWMEVPVPEGAGILVPLLQARQPTVSFSFADDNQGHERVPAQR